MRRARKGNRKRILFIYAFEAHCDDFTESSRAYVSIVSQFPGGGSCLLPHEQSPTAKQMRNSFAPHAFIFDVARPFISAFPGLSFLFSRCYECQRLSLSFLSGIYSPRLFFIMRIIVMASDH
jgi:hypothetical protein